MSDSTEIRQLEGSGPRREPHALGDRLALPAIRDEGGVEPSGSGHAAAVKLCGASAEDLDDVGLFPIAAPH